MSYPATPESQDYMLESHQFVNQGYIMPEWSTLDVYPAVPPNYIHYTDREYSGTSSGNVTKQPTHHQNRWSQTTININHSHNQS